MGLFVSDTIMQLRRVLPGLLSAEHLAVHSVHGLLGRGIRLLKGRHGVFDRLVIGLTASDLFDAIFNPLPLFNQRLGRFYYLFCTMRQCTGSRGLRQGHKPVRRGGWAGVRDGLESLLGRPWLIGLGAAALLGRR